MTPPAPDFAVAFSALERHGLLLESDAVLPSVASLVAGEPVKGSWWGHARGQAIFAATRALAEHRHVVSAKLVSGKVTYVHSRLWPALLAVARSREAWQVADLPLAARAGLTAVERAGTLRASELPGSELLRKTALKHLEQRLLVHSTEVHSEKGSHAKVLETWDAWAARAKASKRRVAPARARQELDEVVRSLNILCNGAGRLPWWPKDDGTP